MLISPDTKEAKNMSPGEPTNRQSTGAGEKGERQNKEKYNLL